MTLQAKNTRAHSKLCRRKIRKSAFILCLAIAGSAQASNEVVNPEFDMGLLGWSTDPIGLSGTASIGSPSAPSGKVHTSVPARLTTQLTQCVPTYTRPLDFFLRVKVDKDSSGPYPASAAVLETYSGLDCTGFLESSPVIEAIKSLPDGWVQFGRNHYVPHLLTQSVLIRLSVSAEPGASSNTQVLYDNVYLGPSDLIFVDDFE